MRTRITAITTPTPMTITAIMCSRKRERRCAVLLQIREEALAEWCRAESLHDVRAAWGRLGSRTIAHRRGSAWFRELALRRWGRASRAQPV